MTEIKINTPFIKLDSFLKLAGAADTGGHAKAVITSGEVLVNGSVCLTRGKKLFGGETVEFCGETFKVIREE